MDNEGKVVVQVREADDANRASTIDILFAPHENRGSEHERVVRLLREQVPFEREFVDVPATIVIRQHPAETRLVMTCDVVAADGTRRMLGRSSGEVGVFVLNGHGIFVSGLSDPAPAG